MIRNKGVTKSLRELWKQHLRLSRQEKKKNRSQVTIAIGLVERE